MACHKFAPKNTPFCRLIPKPHLPHARTRPTYDDKRHPDPIRHFATMHWTERQTDRRTDSHVRTDRSSTGKFDDYRPLRYESARPNNSRPMQNKMICCYHHTVHALQFNNFNFIVHSLLWLLLMIVNLLNIQSKESLDRRQKIERFNVSADNAIIFFPGQDSQNQDWPWKIAHLRSVHEGFTPQSL